MARRARSTAQRGIAPALRHTGCYWASRVIAREGWAGSPATLAAAHNGRAVALWFEAHSGPVSRRAVVLFFIVALHVLMIYAFLSGLLVRIGNAIPQSLEVSVSNEVLPHPQALPPPRPVLTAPQVVIPRPDVDVDLPPDPAAIRVPVRPRVAPSTAAHAGSVRKPDVWILGGPGKGFPDTDDYYPQLARRLDEAGTATVHVCIDARGKLTSAPLVSRSSGHATIDGAALRLAQAGSGHYRPTTDNGVPVSSCFEYPIRLNLRD